MAAASPPPALSPARALLHPAWLVAVALLALNDHVLKGSSLLPGLLTGKLSDFVGLFSAPALLAVLVRAKSVRALVCCHLATGVVFTAIKVSHRASDLFTSALALVHVPWRNVVDPTDLVALPSLLAAFVLLKPWMRPGVERRELTFAAVALALPVMVGTSSPDEDRGISVPARGASQGERKAGGGTQGVSPSSEIAVDPLGEYFVSTTHDGKLLVGALSPKVTTKTLAIERARLVTFFAKGEGSGFFVATTGPNASAFDEKLIAYSISEDRIVWERADDIGVLGLAVAPAGGRLVAWNGERVSTFDTKTGIERGALAARDSVVAVQVASEIVITEPYTSSSTRIRTASLTDATVRCEVAVGACSSEMVIGPGGGRAFVADWGCGEGGVHVVDLTTCSVERTLPGSGPVALSKSGATVVAFIDRSAPTPTAAPLPDEVKTSAARYHLMFIDPQTLSFTTMPIGDALPRFATTADDNVVLVDSPDAHREMLHVDIAKKQATPFSGPRIGLDNYVVLPDGSAVFALSSRGLYRVDLSNKTAATVPFVPALGSINLTPSGATLLAKDGYQTVRLLDVVTQAEVGSFP